MEVVDNHKKLQDVAGWESHKNTQYSTSENWPSISIVIPSFNQGNYIEITLLSLIAQEYPSLEIIVMDGGSTDQTVDILKQYNEHLHFWVSEKDNGQSDAINKGIAKCTGDLFNWLNSDDYLMPNALKAVGLSYMVNKAPALSGPIFNLRDNKLVSVIPPVKRHPDIFNTIHYTGFNQPGFFYETEIVKELKGVDEYFHYGMDLDLWNRFLFTYGQDDVQTVDAHIAAFRLHEESKTEIETQKEFSLFDQDISEMYYSYTQGALRKYCYKVLNPGMQYKKKAPKTPLPSKRVNTYYNQYFYLKFLSHLYRFRLRKAITALLGVQFIYLFPALLRTISKRKAK